MQTPWLVRTIAADFPVTDSDPVEMKVRGFHLSTILIIVCRYNASN